MLYQAGHRGLCSLWAVFCLQDDIDEVNKIAHNLKARLDNLARMNEAALKRKVRHNQLAQIKEKESIMCNTDSTLH